MSPAGRPREGQIEPNSDAAKFGRHLEELISNLGLTVPEFARKIGKTPAVVNHYIKGIRTPPFSSWRRLSKALGLKNVRELVPTMPN